MGEKRKARITNNERTSKKEKKTINVVTTSASNDDIEEQSSMHSNSNTSDSHSQPPSITEEEVNHPEELEESQIIPEINVENVTNEDPIELNSSMNDNNHLKISHETTSWWSSLVRFFHFGHHPTNEMKSHLMENSMDHQSSTFSSDNYLGNVKCRRSLHGESFIG